MKTRPHLFLVAGLTAALLVPPPVFAQTLSKNVNQSRKFRSVISGGAGNSIFSNTIAAAIPGGFNNSVAPSGSYSLAAGRRAKANHSGCFVWGDSTDADFASGASNQFLLRADFAGINCTNPLYYTEVFGVRSPQTDFYGGMYVRTSGDTAKPYYGFSVNGGVDAWTYVDGADGKKWKLYVNGDRITAATNGFVGINCTNQLLPTEIFGVCSPQTNYFGGMYVRTSGSAALPFYGYSVNGGIDAWSYVDGSDGKKWKLNVGAPTNGPRITVTTNGLVGLGTNAPTHPLQMASGARVTVGGVWENASDAALKKNFRPVDRKKILAKVASLPVSKWNYAAEPGVDRMGPMAQDFHAAFALGSDDKHISTLDSAGVMYAAIQGLVEELKERDEAMAARDRKIEELKAKNSELSRSIKAINERLDALPPAPPAVR